jgi:hypothetical protein
MWTTCLRSASSRYHAEFHEGCYQKHTNPLNCRNSSSDIPGYHADFNEEHSTVREWRGATWLVLFNAAGLGRGTAWAQHDMCELPLRRSRCLAGHEDRLTSRHGAEPWTLRAANQKYLESFEMWRWRRMEKISWTDHVRNGEVLLRVKEQR